VGRTDNSQVIPLFSCDVHCDLFVVEVVLIQYRKKRICDCCGIDESLETDHINKDDSGNIVGNHQTLCKHCHTQKGKMGLPLFNYIKDLCGADPRMKTTMQQGSLRWLRKTIDYLPKSRSDNAKQPLLDIGKYEPYTDDEVKLIISTFIRGNPAIYNE